MRKNRLKSVRKSEKYTKEDLAKLMGVSNEKYERFEEDEIPLMLETVQEISKNTGIDAEYIAGSCCVFSGLKDWHSSMMDDFQTNAYNDDERRHIMYKELKREYVTDEEYERLILDRTGQKSESVYGERYELIKKYIEKLDENCIIVEKDI